MEFFVGRLKEIERLRSMVKASALGRFKIGFVSGERGIGKSSLVSFVRHISERNGDAAGCHIFLGGVKELDEMVKRTFERLLKESIDKPWSAQVKDFFGNSIREVGLFGVSLELDLSSSALSTLTDSFVPSIRDLIEKLKQKPDREAQGGKKSLLLILDDINGLASSQNFANWLKSIVDEIGTSEKETRLCILIVGLEDRRQALIKQQPSIARVFEVFEITPWADGEVRKFYLDSFSSASAKVAGEDVDMLIRFTGGLPVLAHEIGDAVWRTAQDLEIKRDDILDGILKAAEMIGLKLLEPEIFSAIRSKQYWSIFRKMADDPFAMHFQKSKLEERLTTEEKKVLNNFLQRMKRLGVLAADPEVWGGYRFQNQLYLTYFWLESRRAQKMK